MRGGNGIYIRQAMVEAVIDIVFLDISQRMSTVCHPNRIIAYILVYYMVILDRNEDYQSANEGHSSKLDEQ